MPKVWNKRDPECPKDAIYIGRPSKWGNPFKIGADRTRERAILLYSAWFEDNDWLQSELSNLKGKDLVCWCAPLPCHGDFLLEAANPLIFAVSEIRGRN